MPNVQQHLVPFEEAVFLLGFFFFISADLLWTLSLCSNFSFPTLKELLLMRKNTQ